MPKRFERILIAVLLLGMVAIGSAQSFGRENGGLQKQAASFPVFLAGKLERLLHSR
jgi:hypothetical protein